MPESASATSDWIATIQDRIMPADPVAVLSERELAIIVAIAAAVVLIGPIWRVVRLAVTLTHELGHAVVGMVFGRKFVGFVVRGDMSGEAVTAGPRRGLGRIATTWSGYPAPAVVGAAAVWLGARGWAAPVITAVIVVLVLALIRVRSVLTALVVVGVGAGIGALWWWRDDVIQLGLVAGAGIVLAIGGWRHLWSLASHRSRDDDASVLAQLTHLPRVIWLVTFVAVSAACSWVIYDGLV